MTNSLFNTTINSTVSTSTNSKPPTNSTLPNDSTLSNNISEPNQLNQLNEILNNTGCIVSADNLQQTLNDTIDGTSYDTINDSIFEDFSEGYYIGMMSGTSLDGMDAVIVSFDRESNTLPIKLVATHSKNFDVSLKTVLLALCQPNGIIDLPNNLAENELTIDSLVDDDILAMSELDWFGWASRVYSEFTSEVVFELLEKAKMNTDDVLAIGCHGQTVRHRPQHGFTLQLVDPNIIAEFTGISVVSDFRRRDMATGGQGAPLVPAFHQAIFSANRVKSNTAHSLETTNIESTNKDDTKILLNLGGISNITVLPASNSHNEILGYDTGPANLLIDAWAKQHILKSYDANGGFARSGQIIELLLQQLLKHPFFALSAPKSTGREDFHLDWLECQLDIFSQHQPNIRFSPADVQATLTELTAITASQHVNLYTNINQGKKSNNLYICGGGAYNGYLLERLTYHLPNWEVTTTDDLGLSPTWVEAVAFAWLARQNLMGEAGNLPTVTGAKKKVVLGQVCFG